MPLVRAGRGGEVKAASIIHDLHPRDPTGHFHGDPHPARPAVPQRVVQRFLPRAEKMDADPLRQGRDVPGAADGDLTTRTAFTRHLFERGGEIITGKRAGTQVPYGPPQILTAPVEQPLRQRQMILRPHALLGEVSGDFQLHGGTGEGLGNRVMQVRGEAHPFRSHQFRIMPRADFPHQQVAPFPHPPP